MRKEIGKKIRQALIIEDLTQTQLAQKLGVRQQAVSKWINGAVSLSIDTLERVAQALNKDLSFFISAEDISKEKTFERSTADYDIREIELLKKEIDILKRELALLKRERALEIVDETYKCNSQ